jgi:hypothetical protein
MGKRRRVTCKSKMLLGVYKTLLPNTVQGDPRIHYPRTMYYPGVVSLCKFPGVNVPRTRTMGKMSYGTLGSAYRIHNYTCNDYTVCSVLRIHIIRLLIVAATDNNISRKDIFLFCLHAKNDIDVRYELC